MEGSKRKHRGAVEGPRARGGRHDPLDPRPPLAALNQLPLWRRCGQLPLGLGVCSALDHI